MKFTKMHGIGNDYVYVNCFEETVEDPAAVARFVSDRHFGIGSDGLILIKPSEAADCEMDMYNVEVREEHTVPMRVWDRGSGETLACGTGACAVAVASILNERVDSDKPVTVKLLGGDLEIYWNRQENLVYMTGPATTVFDGEIDLSFLK